jgi:hypothetical protein
LRLVWQEALSDQTPDISPNEVLDRLERKYQTIADAGVVELFRYGSSGSRRTALNFTQPDQ